MPVKLGDLTVNLNYEVTETSKQLIRGIVAEVLKVEVRKALAEEIHLLRARVGIGCSNGRI